MCLQLCLVFIDVFSDFPSDQCAKNGILMNFKMIPFTATRNCCLVLVEVRVLFGTFFVLLPITQFSLI
jgi:hypothetical protein